MNLVAFVGTDKENWGQITALINRMECEKITLVQNSEAENFPKNSKCQIISVNSKTPLIELKKEILEKLKDPLRSDFEVAVSLASGTGKEHMALLSALLTLPVGVRMAVFTKEGVELIT